MGEFVGPLQEVTEETNRLADAVSENVRVTMDEIIAAVRAAETKKTLAAASALLGKEITDLAEAERILEIAAANSAEAIEAQRQKAALAARDISSLTEAVEGLDEAFDVLTKINVAQWLDSFEKDMPDLFGGALADANRIAETEAPKIGKSFSEGFKASLAKLPDVIIGAIQGGGDVAGAIGASLGADIGAELGEKLTESLTGALGETLAGALGGLAGPLGAIVGGLAGDLFGSLFGDPEKEVNKLRDSFFDLNGGFVAVQQSLVGLTDQDLVRQIFDAETVDEFNAAVAEVNSLLGLQSQAEADLKDAVDRYGFSIDELGPKWQQQELDKQVGQLLKDYELLVASGIDVNTVIEKMGPNLNEYVQTAIKAGAAIPENMRPIIDAMIKQGTLLDENGKAYTSAEDAGITFTQSLTEGLAGVIESIKELVAALTGVPPVNIPVNVNYRERGKPDVLRGGRGGRGGSPSFDNGDGDFRDFARGGVVLPFRPRAAAEGLVVPSRAGGELVRMGEGGQAELAAPVRALLAQMQETAVRAAAAAGGEQRIVLEVDGQVLSEVVVRRNRAGLLPVRSGSVRRS